MRHSQLNQAWAVLSGAAIGQRGKLILRECLDGNSEPNLATSSTAMCFYMLRALSMADDDLYNDYFHQIWEPWRAQLALGLTTWEEDSISHRSDCHAWGSAPIYEFLAEVAGIGPADPGWAAIEFKPRLKIFPEFEATVPLRMVQGQISGCVHVTWTTTSKQNVEITLEVDLRDACTNSYSCQPSAHAPTDSG